MAIGWPDGNCWNGILIYSVANWNYEFKYAVLIIPEHSPYGPSPLGRPSSETRAFLSPPTLLEGPLRLSPLLPGGGGRGILFKHLYYSRFLPYFIFSSQLIFKMIFKNKPLENTGIPCTYCGLLLFGKGALWYLILIYFSLRNRVIIGYIFIRHLMYISLNHLTS